MTKNFTRHVVAFAVGLVMASTSAMAAPDWQRQVMQLVAAKQTYPRAAQMRGDEGTAKVRVTVSASGAVQNVELIQPSGSSVLDREAIALPAKVGNFPAPPAGTSSVVLPLTWKLL